MYSRAHLVLAVALVACAHHVPSRRDAGTPNPLQAVRATADADVAEGDSVRIEHLSFGAARVGVDTFAATFVNLTDAELQVGAELRTTPGMWIQGNWQNAVAVGLHPRERLRVELPYQIFRLTVEGAVRVRFGTPVRHATYVGIERPFFTKRYIIGAGNPEASDPSAGFLKWTTPRLELLALPGSAAARDFERIATERERALDQIVAAAGVGISGRVRMVFYPDSATKRNETGHTGLGFANGNDIIEIYNEQVHLNPFHELTHIVAARIGSPPALFDEGFATYMTEALGARALTLITDSTLTVDAAACAIIRAGNLIAVDSLLRMVEFGSLGAIGYPESASIVKYLIERYGLDAFRAAYASLRAADDRATQADNVSHFVGTFGRTPRELEADWRSALACGPTRLETRRPN